MCRVGVAHRLEARRVSASVVDRVRFGIHRVKAREHIRNRSGVFIVGAKKSGGFNLDRMTRSLDTLVKPLRLDPLLGVRLGRERFGMGFFKVGNTSLGAVGGATLCLVLGFRLDVFGITHGRKASQCGPALGDGSGVLSARRFDLGSDGQGSGSFFPEEVIQDFHCRLAFVNGAGRGG
ncbi:hypothetical protein CQ12_38000 [Bradyrhizobium jicamae]|uniref:Uncharacterized protein n=1 Tax=Bradyrhizobium jicamae TaxID=280332 RepID=A0A0R3KTK5_9BRAD|nr:hypothetical protein CQ12_38000 [Bradyrhizobium jicamae]